MRFLCVSFLLIAASAFAGVTVQNGQMTADLNSQPLRQVLDAIKQESGIQIVLDDSVAGTPVSARFENLPVAAGIRKMLEGTGINYAVISEDGGNPDRILISGSEKPGVAPKKLDTRPLSPGNRGVVAPVVLPPPMPIQQSIQNQPNAGGKTPPGLQKRMDMSVNIPTAGGAGTQNNNNNNNMPQNANPNVKQNPNQRQNQPTITDSEDDEDDSADDSGDDEDSDN